ncbi:MAG: hypothetical protein LBU48_03750 [Coriobacteriales bacterium]|jgi:hypothetical protein|nr:hypothetical protein [Coriobacteriales bacterium]
MLRALTGIAGQPLTVEGYAQDFGIPVSAVQFSCDDGETWTSYDLQNADADKNVNWSFTFTLSEPGRYRLLVRAVTQDGRTTPDPATATIDIRQANTN